MAFNSFFANPPANSSNVNPNAGGLFGLSQNTNTTQNNPTTTTPSLFGNTNPAAPNPPTQPSLFGNTNTNTGTNSNTNQNTTTSTGGSLFGQQPQQPSPGGLGTSTQAPSLFGNTNTNASANTTTTTANTGSLFGQQSTGGITADGGQQGSTQPPSLFGNTNTNTGTNTNANQTSTTNTGGSLFGQLPQPSIGGGIFGNTLNPTSTSSTTGGGTGNIFGNTNPISTSSTTGGGTGSIFGNTNPISTSATGGGTGSIFGNTNPTSTSATGGGTGNIFGNTNPTSTSSTGGTGNIFGNTNPTATGSTAGGTGSIFGNTNPTATGSTAGGTGSIFGNLTSTGSTGGGTGNIFGNTNLTSTGSTSGGTGGGIFGTNTNTNNTNTNTNTNAGGIFGLGTNTNTNTSNQQQQGTTGTTGNSLFSNPFNQQPQQQPSSNLFNSTTSNSLFSGNKTATGNPFGGSTLGTSTLGTSVLGGGGQQGGGSLLSSRPNTLTSTTGVGTGITQLEAHEQYLKISQGMETIYQAWNPATKNCRFQYIFYNLVDPKQVSMYGRPPNATNDALWEKAVRENPDPTCLVPVIAFGFDDLRERANAQSTQSSSQLQKLTDLSSRLKSLLTEHSISNASRLQRAHNAQTQLTQRLMRLVQHLHLLIPAVRSSSIRVEEEELRGKLEEMEEELKRSRVKGKLNEMWALLGAVGAFMERGRGDGQGGQGGWAVVDEEGLAQITQILAEQQAGLQHLTKILQKDQKDLAIIMGSGTAGGDDGYLANEGENLWSSTNTSLRSSSLR